MITDPNVIAVMNQYPGVTIDFRAWIQRIAYRDKDNPPVTLQVRLVPDQFTETNLEFTLTWPDQSGVVQTVVTTRFEELMWQAAIIEAKMPEASAQSSELEHPPTLFDLDQS